VSRDQLQRPSSFLPVLGVECDLEVFFGRSWREVLAIAAALAERPAEVLSLLPEEDALAAPVILLYQTVHTTSDTKRDEARPKPGFERAG
jgi:hypothetical protein